MKIIFQDFNKGEVKIQFNSLDDLWYLSNIIEENDEVSGKTLRKIKLGDDSDKNVKVVKKPVYLRINVEKVEFHKYNHSLRVSGKVIEGPEDVSRGSYHTFDIDVDTSVKIFKKSWPKYLINKLNEACEDHGPKVLIVALERDNATYAILSSAGYEILTELEGDVGKKGYGEYQEKDFFSEIAKQTAEYDERYHPSNIILASPAFWKEDLNSIIKKKHSHLSSKIVLATCNTNGRNAVEEIIRRDEVKTVLKKDRTLKESALVDDLFKEIAKNASASYGIKEVTFAAEAHAIKILLVTDEYIISKRSDGTFAELDHVMKEVDRSKGEVHIISTDHDAGKRLQGLGGIGAILRYRLI